MMQDLEKKVRYQQLDFLYHPERYIQKSEEPWSLPEPLSMTHEAIIDAFKKARYKNAQIQILADLNCVKPKTIQTLLQHYNLLP